MKVLSFYESSISQYKAVLSKLLARRDDLNLNGTLIEQGTQISTAARSADEIPLSDGVKWAKIRRRTLII
jgi:hypothetical protein